jgi:hypothetical protein
MGTIVKEYPTLEQITTNPSDVSYLLSLANDMRKYNGDSSLDDLPISEPREVGSCIIANAFNYGCEVSPSSISGVTPSIMFQTKQDRDTYLKVIGFSHDAFIDWFGSISAHWCYDEAGHFPAPLTDELNQIALDFDKGIRFVEYVVDDFDEKNDWLEEAQDQNSIDLGIYDEENEDEGCYENY